MCGIVGILASESKGNFATIEGMIDEMRHRGPNGSGIVKRSNFVFGHRRLSVIAPGNEGSQPMEYLGRYVITYNGEVYNYRELREELIGHGVIFRGDSDTEVILAAYSIWGEQCVKRFNGMWAFAIADVKENTVFISRDRFGIKPLYYYHSRDRFVFSSELKALFCDSSIKCALNEQSLGRYVSEGPSLYAEDTPFRDVFRFPAASTLTISLSSVGETLNFQRFWSLKPNVSNEKFNLERAKEYAKTYYTLLEDAVKLRLRADVEVGSALSGGLDSSSIVYLVNKQLAARSEAELQSTFSCVYGSSGTEHCDESSFIDVLVKGLSLVSHRVQPREQDVPVEHFRMMCAMEEPPESTCMSGWHTFKKVQESRVTVTLDGQGADEQLGGYFKYVLLYLLALPPRQFARQAALFGTTPGIRKFLLLAVALKCGRLFLTERGFKRTYEFICGHSYYQNANLAMQSDIESELVNLLHYSDRVSMGHSIESRMPFMDYRLVEFLASVPVAYKVQDGWTKYIARLAFDGKLPDEICWRRDKMGWMIPEGYWLQHGLATWSEGVIERSKLAMRFARGSFKKGIKFGGVSQTSYIRLLNLAVFENVWKDRIDH